jgi:type I restriction enzyme S subunit
LLPPTKEQEHIAAFLDWKTSQIDALIEKKQALIGKLKEKRLAVITQAVTKGLDLAVPMRESGISWLGKVPASWNVKRLRYCAGTVTSGSRGWAQFFSESGALFLRITNLDRESISLKLDDLQRVEPPDGAEGARTLTKAGDLLISITADLGSVAVIPDGFESAYISQHLSLVRLDSENIDPNWIAYSILSLAGKYQLNTAGYGGTKIQLSLSDIKDITFCHPTTLDEQRRVLRAVQNEIERNNKLIELAEDAIARLTEYRTALITAATTGKIDVRQIKVPAHT